MGKEQEQVSVEGQTAICARARLRSFWPGIVSALILGACMSAFQIERIDNESYAPTPAIVWLDREPERPYIVIARFRGSETGYCPLSTPNCSLVKSARELGADAIWVQKRDRQARPELWVDIQGRMTRIPESIQEMLEGALVRYR